MTILKEILLNPCGDYTIENGDWVYVEGADAVRQKWLIRVRTFMNEWILDSTLGVPYIQEIFQKLNDRRKIESIFRDITLGTPGVIFVESVKVGDINPTTRSIDITVEAYIEGDEQVTFSFDGTLGPNDCPLIASPGLPAEIPGLIIWFDAQDTTALSWAPLTSTLIMQNKAGPGEAVGQGDTGKPQLIGGSPINGHRAVFLDNDSAVNKQTLNISNTPAIRDVAGLTMIVVARPTINPVSEITESLCMLSLDGVNQLGSSPVEQEYYNFFYDIDVAASTTTKLKTLSKTLGSVTASTYSTDGVAIYSPEIYTFRIDYTSASQDFYRDFTSLTATGSINEALFNGEGYGGAALPTSITDFFRGHIGEIIVYDNKITDASLDILLDYLAVKWGISTAATGFGYFPFGLSPFGL